ncbi:MAG: transcriptional repressor LexA [Gemmatimonadaceae bacterium]
MAEPLTQLEQGVYHYMIDFLAENTYQPSIREIARQFRIRSTKTVSDLLHSLETKGFIAREESRSRGVRLLGFAAAGATQPIPYYREIAPSGSALSQENRAAYMTVDRRFLPSEDVFCLKAHGDAMRGRGILDGDYVMVSPSARAVDGDIVAARLAGRSTVKMLAHRGETIVLESANDVEVAIEVHTEDDFALLGVVCGVFRPYFEQSDKIALPAQDAPVS